MLPRLFGSFTSTPRRGLRAAVAFTAVAAALVLAGCRGNFLAPDFTPTPEVHCAAPTAEYFWVEPVTSPTTELSQVVSVHLGNMEVVTITAESGVFTATDGQVEVMLLPNTTHQLEVAGRVKEMGGSSPCRSGGYTLHTTQDSQGAPLTIVQEQPNPP